MRLQKQVLGAFSLLEVLLALLILSFVAIQVYRATNQIAILPTAPQFVTMRAEELLQKIAILYDKSGQIMLPASETFGDYTIQIVSNQLANHYLLEAKILRENSPISVLFLIV